MANELISIIVPIYNEEVFLRQCLDSICRQTYVNIEIILVDDGSSDSSGIICDEYAEKDKRIKVIHKINEGLVKARKVGIEVATGNLIGYVDGDDWIEHDMYERLCQSLTYYDVDIAMCGRCEDSFGDSRMVCHGFPPGKYDKSAMIEKIYPNMIVNGAFFDWGVFPSVWDKLFKREFIEGYQRAVDDRITMGEDAACTYPALLNANSIYILGECLYHYRQSDNSMVRQIADSNLQRMRFKILYESVNASFEKYRYIYDLKSQWRDYVLFLAVPRVESLYEGINELNYLFPFPKIKRGSNIIIYGMGTYGNFMYSFVKRNGICNVIACADRNYELLSKRGLSVISANDISDYDYDAIVIASSYAKVRKEIYENLTKKYPREKIYVMDELLIKSNDTMRALGLV